VAAPGWAEPVAASLMLEHQAPDFDLLSEGRRLLDDVSTRGDERAYLHYALGKVEAAAARHDRAWEHWTGANALRREQSRPEAHGALQERIDALRALYTPEVVGAMAARAPVDHRPVLVVGMPRSGTTLVEQVLAAHPDVRGAGECPELPRLHIGVAAAADGAGFEPGGSQALARRYLDGLERRAGGDAARLVDKQPYNFMFLGLAAGILPAARIVWCRRDPRDVAVSIFSENFAPHARYATDLREIRDLIEAQESLMAHWCETLALPVLQIRYEDFVADLPAQARRLVEFAALPWNEACLGFHTAGGTVQTNSRWQVRRPVSQASVGRWRHHREALAQAGFAVD
jgi:hypothetical protein